MNRKLIEKSEYLLSKEKGTVFKDPGGKIRIALAYPNIYPVGMSSLGFQGIYGLLNSIDDVVCERVFLPEQNDIREYERTGTRLFTMESKRPLSKFDIIAFSVSFENDYPNILKMLNMSGIPLKSSERKEFHPLVILGGVCAFYNPEPIADYFDICFVGESEEMLPEFLSVYRSYPAREKLFESSLRIEGIYIPRYYSIRYSDSSQIAERKSIINAPEVIKKRTVKDISKSVITSVITTPEAEFSDMYLLEAMRGCPWSCRFCVAGHIYKPVRKKDLNIIKRDIEDAMSKTKRVGLIGPSLSDYPYAEEVLSMEGVDFSITSLRASPRSGRIVQLMKGHKSVSIAPEAGTQRLRDVINKRITERDILETAGMILGSGIETLRLYFMVGLPTEKREDIEGMIDLVKKIRENNRRGFITLSVNTFVPKPFTPFQWHPMESLNEVKDRLKMVKKGLSRLKGVKIFHDVPKYAYLQGLFAMGDRRVSGIIEKTAFKGNSLQMDESPDISRDFFIFRFKDITEILPWDFIDAGVSKEKLWEEYKKAVGT
ncbi:MAG: radical SAM protein [Nitrospirota bacterium]